jgi:enamine deaminase RidA (YjgF/YER057c/UK114 family)
VFFPSRLGVTMSAACYSVRLSTVISLRELMSIEKELYKAGPYADFFSQGVRVGDALYLAGQVGMTETGEIPTDLPAQVEAAYRNIASVLSEFGATMDNIVDETFFVTDMKECMNQLPAVFGARQAAYGKKPEVAQTLIGVSALVDQGLKVEIKVIAKL